MLGQRPNKFIVEIPLVHHTHIMYHHGSIIQVSLMSHRCIIVVLSISLHILYRLKQCAQYSALLRPPVICLHFLRERLFLSHGKPKAAVCRRLS